MKKVLLLIMLMTSVASYAQKKWVGTNLGLTYHLNDIREVNKMAYKWNIADFGYCWGRFGVHGQVFTSTNRIDHEILIPFYQFVNVKSSWILNGVSTGPMVNLSKKDNLDFFVKGITGFGVLRLKINDKNVESESCPLAGVGVLLRTNVNSRWSYMVAADYMVSKFKFKKYDVKQSYSSLNLTCGVSYNL